MNETFSLFGFECASSECSSERKRAGFSILDLSKKVCRGLAAKGFSVTNLKLKKAYYVFCRYCTYSTKGTQKLSGDDALMGNTRSHSEHDSEDVSGRWYLVGDCPGE